MGLVDRHHAARLQVGESHDLGRLIDDELQTHAGFARPGEELRRHLLVRRLTDQLANGHRSARRHELANHSHLLFRRVDPHALGCHLHDEPLADSCTNGVERLSIDLRIQTVLAVRIAHVQMQRVRACIGNRFSLRRKLGSRQWNASVIGFAAPSAVRRNTNDCRIDCS